MPTRVKVNIGYKVNMGDYENIDFNFGIEDDVPEGSTMPEHFEKCFNWTFNRLEKEVEKARAAARG